MKKGKVTNLSKKTSKSKPRFSLNSIIISLTLIPLFFSALFQGGYFPWETYLTFLISIPAILLFLISKFKVKDNELVPNIRKSGADLSLVIFLFVCFISLFFTVYFHATLTEFFKVLIYLIIFYIVVNVVESEKEFRIVYYALLGLSVLLSILGLVGYVGFRLSLTLPIFSFASRYGFTQGDRIASTLQYSNTFAAFLLIPIFLSFSGFINESKIPRKIVYLTLSLLFLLTFILTQSRGALVALAISIVLFLLLLKGKERKFSLLTFVGLLVGVIIVVVLKKDVFLPVLQGLLTRIKLMFSFFKGQWEESLGDRVYMLKDSLRILKNYPILGTGNGTYQYVYAKYRTIYFFSKFPHSIFFQVLDEIGIFGGAAFIYMIFSLFKKGFRVIKENYSPVLIGIYAGLLGVFLHALVDFDWSLMFMPLMFFYLFAMLISQSKKDYFTFKCPLIERFSKKKKPVKSFKIFDSEKVRLAKMKGFGIALTIILAVVFLFQFIAGFANFKARKSIGINKWEDTVSMYKTAIALNPLASEYHYDLANFNFSYLVPAATDPTQFVKEAETEYLAAIKHCPTFFLYHFELGKIYLQTGNEKAIDEFTKTLQLNPLDPGAHATLGFAYLNLKKDTSMAKIQLEEALRLDPNNADAYLGMGSLYEELKEPDKALENYQLAIKYNSENAYAYYRAGVIYDGKGMLPEAVNNLFWAIKYNSNLSDAKTAFEKYAPLITILKPQPNEAIEAGSKYEIVWLASNDENLESFAIYLIPSQGNWISLSSVPKYSFNYVWQVPQDFATGTYTIRIYATSPKFMQGRLDNWLSFEEVKINIVK